MKTLSLLGLILISVVWSGSSLAKTIYVEQWGDDSFPGGCGSKLHPCRNISTAQVQSMNNDRIVVGPGVYSGSLYINRSGLKLESTGGRFATVIDASASAIPTLHIGVPNVRVGKKGKGFTVRGADVTTIYPLNAGLRAIPAATRLRVEGNQFTANHNGITLLAENALIRGNIIKDNALNGIYCSACDQAVIAENRLFGNYRGLDILSTDRISILKNHIHDDGFTMRLDGNTRTAKIQDNVSEDNGGGGFAVSNFDGLDMRGNIAAILNTSIDNGAGIFIEQQLTSPFNNAKHATVKHNLSLGNSQRGFRLMDLVDAKLFNNHAVQNDFDGIYLGTNGAQVSAELKNNASYENQSNCGLYNATGTSQSYKNHFFSAGEFACNGWSGDGKMPAKPASLNINRARKL